jgi:putative ABC transport system permease protein
MSLWRQLARGVHALTNRESADLDVSDEVQHYVEQSAAERIARGSSPGEAQRAALLEVGNMTVAREQLRSYGWENVVTSLAGDLQFGLRRLRRNPGFTATAVLTLALGIGASTAIFSAVKPILFETLPYPQANRLAMISDMNSDGEAMDVTYGTYRELAQRSHTLELMAPINQWRPAIVGDEKPERLVGQRVGANFFRALGLSPLIGRDFRPEDDRPNGPRVVILSSALWQRRFNSDRSIIGQTILLDATEYTVIGVMSRAFENVLEPAAEVWSTLQYNEVFDAQSREWGHHLRVVARLLPGVTIVQAREELNRVARTPVPEFARVPWASLSSGLLVSSLQADVTRAIRPTLIAVLVGVALVLLIVCVNVTNLMLARGAQRRGEFAMRAALGAGRTRLARQVLTESVALALIGGVIGMLVAQAGVAGIVALSPPGLPRLGAIRLDATVFAFGFVITTIIGVMVGMLPALNATGPDLHSGTKESSPRTSGGHRRARGLLVVAEVALALVLLVSAGLLFRSIKQVFAVRVGFDSSQLLTMLVQESGSQFQADSFPEVQSDGPRYRFYSDALDAVQQVQGVTAASFTSLLPLSGDVDTYGVHFELDPDPKTGGAALRYAVTPGYFAAMRIPLRHGRLLDARDGPGAPRAALINESFAKRKFAGKDAIGNRLRFGPEEGDWYSIVGVVGDVRQSSLQTEQPDAIYIMPTQWHWVDNQMSLVVRTRADAAALAPAIRSAIWSVDKNMPIARVATMRALVDRSVADRHFALILFEAFGLSALMLAAIGIYGVLSGSVTERTREIGVRSALGASTATIVGMIVRVGMTLTVAGVVVGVIAAGIASRVVVSMLFGVSRLDPTTYLSVISLLCVVSAIACGVPALRAARVDPANTLKAM